ncbi:MAG TPA: hypothetical protein PLG20_03590 [Candidatus Syntrophosphaera sp.]|jgi:hypothetical protein|nr:hypothetical protein [Candidatus Syntrophosphaera sp.]
MNTLHRVIHSLFKLLFGEFNGVQVFFYPLTLFWWIDSDSFLLAVTGLLTNQRHYFPLCLFLLVIVYLAFLIVKNSSAIFKESELPSHAARRSFNNMVVEVHKILLITIVTAALIYAVAAFLHYYYNIRVPLKTIYPLLYQLFSVALILWYTLKNKWTKPLREAGKSMERAYRLVRRDLALRPREYLLHGLTLILMVMIGSYIYNLIVVYLLFPFFASKEAGLKVILLEPATLPALLYDVFIFAVAFMLSNLLFSPFVRLITHFSDKLNPQLNKPNQPDYDAQEN